MTKSEQLGKKRKKKNLKKEAWKWCSLYVRTRDCIETLDSLDEGLCFTCDATVPFKSAQAGHFIPGRNNKVLFDVDQIRLQCYHCNIGLKGNWVEYLKRIRLLWGEEVVDKMLEEHNQPVKYTDVDYQNFIDRFKHDYNELIRCFKLGKNGII